MLTLSTLYAECFHCQHCCSCKHEEYADLTSSEPKPYHHGDLRRALVSAGIELLAEGGAAGLDLRKVARRAGVSHAAPYRHFEDKRALLAAIAEEGFMRLTNQLREAVADVPPQSQLLALAQAYVHFALAEPALMREMFSGLSIDRMAYPSLHAASKVAFNVLLDVVKREQEAGTWVRDDPEKMVLVMWSMLHGLAMLLLENQMPMVTVDPAGVDDIIQRCVARLYDGVRPR